MSEKLNFFKRINVRIVTVLIAMFIVAGAGIIILNYYSLKNAYVESLTERLVVCNTLTATLLDSGEIASYVSLLAGQDDAFKQEQIEFNNNRERLYMLQKSGGGEDEEAELIAKIKAFHDKMDGFKTESFEDAIMQIKKIKDQSDARYLYVVAFTGVVNVINGVEHPMMTYIYDSEDIADSTAIDSDGLGTVTYFEDYAFDIYRTKQAMNAAYFYDEKPYGQLYFSYAPVLDKENNVVAIVGTDIGVEHMNALLNRTVLIDGAILLVLVVIVIGFFYFYVRRYLLTPISTLTDTATKLADGDVYASVPPDITNAGNELGILAKSIDDMGGVYRDMITSTGQLLDAANAGKLEVRNDPSRFKGDISKVVAQFNETLDSTILYLNSVPESLFLVDNEFNMLFKNRMVEMRSPDKSGRQLMSDILFKTDNASVADLKEKLSEIMSEGDGTIKRWVDGIFYSIVFKYIDEDDIANSSVLVIAMDVTALENEKVKALTASAAKSEFLSRVSHELRTPMNVIIGMSSLGVKEEKDPKTLDRFKHIEASSKHLLGIINDVLDMSRIESGKMNITNHPFNIKNMLDDCRTMFEGQAADKKIKFMFDVDQNIPDIVDSDEQHIKQVLINLLSNAFKFTRDEGRISLSVKAKKLYDGKADLQFTVADNGIGMSDEFMNKIFNAFEQDSVYLQRKEKGTGLGLSICKNLVTLMGGEISVESKQNAGSTFKVELSLAVPEVQEEAPEPVIPETDISGMRVMLVDDIEINRVIFKEMMSSYNIIVTEAGDGTEVLEIFKKSKPFSFDIIFMDIQMIEMDGYEATRRIRALKRADHNVAIIAMTANAMKQDVDTALASGMNGHIAKPIDPNLCVNEMRKYYKKPDGEAAQ